MATKTGPASDGRKLAVEIETTLVWSPPHVAVVPVTRDVEPDGWWQLGTPAAATV